MMSKKDLFVKAVLVWCILLVGAIVNGTVRTFGYRPFIGDLAAHQISTFIFIGIIFAVTYVAYRKNFETIEDICLLSTGSVWLLLTVAFEFLAGHFLFGSSWEKLFADYDFMKGRIWILVLIATWMAPYITGKIFKKKL